MLSEKSHLSESEQSINVGNLAIDLSCRSTVLGERRIDLTDAEFEVLWYLAQNAGRAVSRDELHNAVLGTVWDGLDRCIDLRVSRLRRKLGDDGRNPRLIKSVRYEGYLLAPDIS